MPQLAEQEKPRERKVYLQRPGTQKELAEYVEKSCRSLFGSDILYDSFGNIFYRTWPRVRKAQEETIPFAIISQLPSQVEIFAPRTRYRKHIEKRINKVPTVESAIRAMDHILENIQGKETTQAKKLGERAMNLLNLFRLEFAQITPEQLEKIAQDTLALLTEIGLDPKKVVLEEKAKMADWTIKGSSGMDSLGRKNKLITLSVLWAAYVRAVERQQGLPPMIGKFVRMRSASGIERELDRTIFEEVAYKLRPEAIPAHELFKYPNRPSSNQGIVIGMLNTMRFQLDQPHLNPYRENGLKAWATITEIVELIKEGKVQEIVDRGLFPAVRDVTTTTLETHKDIYPEGKN